MDKDLSSSAFLSTNRAVRYTGMALVMTGSLLWAVDARAQVALTTWQQNRGSTVHEFSSNLNSTEPDNSVGFRARLRRQTVDYSTSEAAGTIVVDTSHTYLYFVLGSGKAIRYGVGVGREGFTWSGAKTIERKSEWPDWLPPADMLKRQPYLPRFMAGGAGNPLGARAMYLSGTAYRIHGTNKPSSIGERVSSGCIRMLNEDVVDLYDRTHIGTKVLVLPADQRHVAQLTPASPAATR
jgi:lipoprotein-anchoring transpeptidase ErfK/SrfK